MAPLSFLEAGCPSCRPTNSVKALKAKSTEASTRKVKQIWILLKQETASGSGTSWAICKSASRSRQITMPASHPSFLQTGCPSCHPTNSVKATKLNAVFCRSFQNSLHFATNNCMENVQHYWHKLCIIHCSPIPSFQKICGFRGLKTLQILTGCAHDIRYNK